MILTADLVKIVNKDVHYTRTVRVRLIGDKHKIGRWFRLGLVTLLGLLDIVRMRRGNGDTEWMECRLQISGCLHVELGRWRRNVELARQPFPARVCGSVPGPNTRCTVFGSELVATVFVDARASIPGESCWVTAEVGYACTMVEYYILAERGLGRPRRFVRKTCRERLAVLEIVQVRKLNSSLINDFAMQPEMALKRKVRGDGQQCHRHG